MWEEFLKLIANNLGVSAFIILILLVGLVFFVWWASKMWNKVNSVDKLPCNTHKEIIDKQIQNANETSLSLTKMNTSIEFMQKSIDLLNQSLQNNRGIIDPFTQRKSPISITKTGYEVVNKLGIYDMVEENWNRINYFIEENTVSKNPYDIQKFLLEQVAVFPEKFISDYDVSRIKMEAYKEGLNIMSYMNVIAILIRDKYFDEHNIDVGDVDKHDPDIPDIN